MVVPFTDVGKAGRACFQLWSMLYQGGFEKSMQKFRIRSWRVTVKVKLEFEAGVKKMRATNL